MISLTCHMSVTQLRSVRRKFGLLNCLAPIGHDITQQLKGLWTKSTSKVENERHHNIKIVSCTEKLFYFICILTYDRKMDKQHTVKTSRSRKLVCEYCKKYCLTLSESQKHIRTHTGEKPFMFYMSNLLEEFQSI